MSDPPRKIIEDEEEFLDNVEAFYKDRGVPFERDAKVAGRSIPLHKLYKMVMDRGGYDQLSGERMQWRTLVKPFGFSNQHEAAMTFQLKSLYYKYLAAYEIASYWGQTPPPREILEDLTAKGGDLRTRTLENYRIPGRRDSIGNELPESGDEEQHTPKIEKMEVEDPGSASRYPTRQLRQDPKKTQVYQPETVARPKYTRTTSSPQPAPPSTQVYNHVSADPRHPAFSLDRYEPRQPIALTLRPVITPGNAPDIFYQRKAQLKAQALPRLPPEPQQFLRYSIPNNMNGPNIYLRCLYGLRSGIQHEQEFALHHLVKVSYERGDKYKFEGFPLLAESLLEKALEITEHVYHTKLNISYTDTDEYLSTGGLTLNGASGTPDLLDLIGKENASLRRADIDTAENTQSIEKMNEAALVIRNMVILEENAIFLSRFPLFTDFLIVALNLPDQPRLGEYKHYALEMAEQVTRYWHLQRKDPLYLSMLMYIESDDRGLILSALRAITRIGIETAEVFQLTDVPLHTVQRLASFLLLDTDDALLEATLDFFYEFTAIPENVKDMMEADPHLLPGIMPRLSVLLLHQAIPTEEKILVRPPPQKVAAPTTIPAVPTELHMQLLAYQEPDRSSRWLRCCFEESAQDDITQIAIWQAYQGRFQGNGPIPAAEFIKNVSNTFTTAQAQVINGPQPRFIIKGIRPRRVLQDVHGRPFFKCMWELARPDPFDPAARGSQRHLCNQWYSTRQAVWLHMLADHLHLARTGDGRFANDTIGNYSCRWSGCPRSSPFNKPNEIGFHLRAHIPDTSEALAKIINEMAGEGKDQEPEFQRHSFYFTAMDDRGHACGIPFMSVMIMRNLARFANKHNSTEADGRNELMEKFFVGVMHQLWHVIGVNRTLRDWVTDLVYMIDKGDREARKGQKREREADAEDMIV